MCWDCYDDFYEEKDPYCPKCDSELISDSEDEQTLKPKTTTSQNQQKTSPALTKQGSMTSTTSATTTAAAQINNTGFNYNDLAKVRVIKKNLVYVIGLSPEIANEETLLKKEYFTQYGKITKIVVNTNNAYNPKGPNGPSYSAYITYSSEREASMAILGTEEYQINDRIIRASYGTTKYCSYFLKQQECPNLPDCLYLHSFGKDKEFFSKDETISNKNIFIDQQKMAIKNIQKYIPDLIKIKNTVPNFTSVLPSPQSVIDRLIEQDVLDIKQKPIETVQIEQKCDKKKKEDTTPLIDQWNIDFSAPTPPLKKDDSRRLDSPSSNASRKQSQSVSAEKEPNINLSQTPIISSPQMNKVKSLQQEQSSSVSTSNLIKSESEKQNINKVSSLQQSEEKLNSKEDFLMKVLNGSTQNSTNQSSQITIIDQLQKMSNNNNNIVQPATSTANNNTNVQVGQPVQVQPISTVPSTIAKSVSPNLQNNNLPQVQQIQNPNQQKVSTSVISSEQTKKSAISIDKSPQKEQIPKPNQEDSKQDELSDSRNKVNKSSISSNQSSNVGSTNHSRTSSINQKNATPTISSSAPLTNGTNTSNTKYNSNPSNQNGTHYEKKENQKKEQNEQKYQPHQKHQYIPVNQVNKQTQQTIQPQKDNSIQPQAQQVAGIKEDNKQVKPSSAAAAAVQNLPKAVQQQNSNSNNVAQQSPQVATVQQVKVNDENTGSSLRNQQASTTTQQTSTHQNHHLQQLHKSSSQESTSETSHYHSYLSHHHAASEPVPKYVLQKVEKLEKTVSSDIQIMKRLITRTAQKNSASRFDFAKNSEHKDQPIEDIDVINNIFNGQYITLTKSQSTRSNCNSLI